MTLIFLPFEHLHNENIKLEIPLHNFILSSHTLIHPSNKENTKPISQILFLFTLPSRPQPNLNLTSPYTSLQVFLSHNTTSRGAQRGQKWQPKPVIRNLRGTIGVSNAITLFHERREERRRERIHVLSIPPGLESACVYRCRQIERGKIWNWSLSRHRKCI